MRKQNMTFELFWCKLKRFCLSSLSWLENMFLFIYNSNVMLHLGRLPSESSIELCSKHQKWHTEHWRRMCSQTGEGGLVLWLSPPLSGGDTCCCFPFFMCLSSTMNMLLIFLLLFLYGHFLSIVFQYFSQSERSFSTWSWCVVVH